MSPVSFASQSQRDLTLAPRPRRLARLWSRARYGHDRAQGTMMISVNDRPGGSGALTPFKVVAAPASAALSSAKKPGLPWLASIDLRNTFNWSKLFALGQARHFSVKPTTTPSKTQPGHNWTLPYPEPRETVVLADQNDRPLVFPKYLFHGTRARFEGPVTTVNFEGVFCPPALDEQTASKAGYFDKPGKQPVPQDAGRILLIPTAEVLRRVLVSPDPEVISTHCFSDAGERNAALKAQGIDGVFSATDNNLLVFPRA